MDYIFQIVEKQQDPKISELGGKGYNLVRLTRGGFQVPEGFIVMASAFTEFVTSCCLVQQVENCSADINEKCALIDKLFTLNLISKDLEDTIELMLTKLKENPSLPTPLLAVRSSGVTEDLDEASFAGMNDTILNVHADSPSVCDAIKKCWRSLFGKRSILYRQEHGFPLFDTAIAVVVQVMIPSESSGVIFTADAQSGSRGEISLDGVHGLGEALVSGMVNTDHWTIRKTYGKRRMHITDTRLGQQEFKFVSCYPNDGTQRIELSEEEGKRSCFTEQQIITVCQVACDIEMYYGKPTDIEFCFYHESLYIVQARPITHLLTVPDLMNPLLNQAEGKWRVWLSLNNMQMLTDPLTPIGASLYRSLSGCSEQFVTQVSGYMYVNMSIMLYPSLIRKVIISMYHIYNNH